MIATESEFAPFEFKILIDAKDSFVGADIELENAIADTLGVDVDFSLMSFNNVLASVTSGKAEMCIRDSTSFVTPVCAINCFTVFSEQCVTN